MRSRQHYWQECRNGQYISNRGQIVNRETLELWQATPIQPRSPKLPPKEKRKRPNSRRKRRDRYWARVEPAEAK